jgi:hypothetical protein
MKKMKQKGQMMEAGSGASEGSMIPPRLSAAKQGNIPKKRGAGKDNAPKPKRSGYGNRGSNDWD